MFFDFLKGEFVDREVDLEKAVGGVRIFVAENRVGERRELGVRLFILVETTRDMAGLVTAQEEGLIFAGFFVAGVETGDDFGRVLKNLGTFNIGLSDGELAVGATLMKGEADFTSVIIPIEGVFHFVAVMVILTIGDNFWCLYGNAVLAENLGH